MFLTVSDSIMAICKKLWSFLISTGGDLLEGLIAGEEHDFLKDFCLPGVVGTKCILLQLPLTSSATQGKFSRNLPFFHLVIS